MPILSKAVQSLSKQKKNKAMQALCERLKELELVYCLGPELSEKEKKIITEKFLAILECGL